MSGVTLSAPENLQLPQCPPCATSRQRSSLTPKDKIKIK